MPEIKPPNFEEMYKLIEVIQTLNKEIQALKVEIEVTEADTVRKATSDKSLSPDGKYLSVTYVKETYKITGINNELTPKRKEMANKVADLDKAKMVFEVMKMQFEAWRTDQSNKRSGLV